MDKQNIDCVKERGAWVCSENAPFVIKIENPGSPKACCSGAAFTLCL